MAPALSGKRRLHGPPADVRELPGAPRTGTRRSVRAPCRAALPLAPSLRRFPADLASPTDRRSPTPAMVVISGLDPAAGRAAAVPTVRRHA